MKKLFRKHVSILKKPGADILASLTPEKCDLMHMASCVMEEAAELYSPIKKHIFYNKPLDMANVRGELGDIMFYIEGVALNLGIDLDEIKAENIEKLKARYPQGYSDQSAQKRADMQICTSCGCEMEKPSLTHYKSVVEDAERLCGRCATETIIGGSYLGKKVVALNSAAEQFTKGVSYDVTSIFVHSDGEIILKVAADDRGRSDNGWSHRNFKISEW